MEIERKWLVNSLPPLEGLEAVHYDRYFIYIDDLVEIRVQKKGEIYEMERKAVVDVISRDDQRITISKAEFEHFKEMSDKSIIRTSYVYNKDPEITIKIYGGDFVGLQRVEVEFSTQEEASHFTPLSWFGEEITHGILGKDKRLIQLSRTEFLEELDKYVHG